MKISGAIGRNLEIPGINPLLPEGHRTHASLKQWINVHFWRQAEFKNCKAVCIGIWLNRAKSSGYTTYTEFLGAHIKHRLKADW